MAPGITLHLAAPGAGLMLHLAAISLSPQQRASQELKLHRGDQGLEMRILVLNAIHTASCLLSLTCQLFLRLKSP